MKAFPSYRELDGLKIRNLIWTEIEPIQKADEHEMWDQHGSYSMSQEFNCSAKLAGSSIVGEAVWDYTISPSGKERHFDFTFTLTNGITPRIALKDKASQKSIGRCK